MNLIEITKQKDYRLSDERWLKKILSDCIRDPKNGKIKTVCFYHNQIVTPRTAALSFNASEQLYLRSGDIKPLISEFDPIIHIQLPDYLLELRYSSTNSDIKVGTVNAWGQVHRTIGIISNPEINALFKECYTLHHNLRAQAIWNVSGFASTTLKRYPPPPSKPNVDKLSIDEMTSIVELAKTLVTVEYLTTLTADVFMGGLSHVVFYCTETFRTITYSYRVTDLIYVAVLDAFDDSIGWWSCKDNVTKRELIEDFFKDPMYDNRTC